MCQSHVIVTVLEMRYANVFVILLCGGYLMPAAKLTRACFEVEWSD